MAEGREKTWEDFLSSSRRRDSNDHVFAPPLLRRSSWEREIFADALLETVANTSPNTQHDTCCCGGSFRVAA